MPQKPLDVPMQVAKAIVKDMKAYFAEPNAIRRDEIAGRQLQALRPYDPRYGKKLRITDIVEMFQEVACIFSRHVTSSHDFLGLLQRFRSCGASDIDARKLIVSADQELHPRRASHARRPPQ